MHHQLILKSLKLVSIVSYDFYFMMCAEVTNTQAAHV